MVGAHLRERAEPVVDAGVDLEHVEPLVEQRDRRQEPVTREAVGPQAVRRIVRRHHEHDAAIEQRGQQPPEDHRVGDVGDVKLVEAHKPPLASNTGSDGDERVFLVLEPRKLFVHVAHERVEVDARLAPDRHRREERVHQKALAASDAAPKVDARAAPPAAANSFFSVD